MSKLFIAILCFFLFSVINGTTITWSGGATGDFSNSNNWTPAQIPTSGDIVLVTTTSTISVSSSITVDQMTNSGALKLVVTNGATFTVNNNYTQGAAVTIQTDSTSSFISVNHFIFSGQSATFNNFGTTSLNPRVIGNVNQGTLTNTQLGNPVIFSGSRRNLINANFFVPSGFVFSQSVQQVFESVLSAGTLTLGYTETIGSNGWNVINDLGVVPSFVFGNGVIFSGTIITNLNILFPRPPVTFDGTVTLNGNVDLPIVPTFGRGSTSPVIFNGNFNLNINLVSLVAVTFNTPNIQGNTNIIFTNSFTVPLTTNFNQNLLVDNPNVNWVGQWIFAGNSLTFSTVKTFAFNVTIGNDVVFQRTATIANGFILLNGGSGGLTFTDGLVANIGQNFTVFRPIFDCTAPNKLFQLSGNSGLIFPLGLTIKGCTVSSSQSMSVSVGIQTEDGNTTLPTSVSFLNSIAFTANTAPSGIFSISLANAITIPAGFSYSANRVEVFSPASAAASIGTGSSLTSSNNGLFTLSGGAGFSTGCTVNALTAFPNGAITLTSNARVDWGGNIILRNTLLGGTADIWFTGNIVAVKGISQITNPNFKFKSAFSLTYLYDQIAPDSGCQLVFNTNGATGSRTFEGGITANTNANIVFDDNVNVNVTSTLTATATNSAITFRTNSASASLSSIATITMNGNYYFNNTNFRFQGAGNFVLSTNPVLYVNGNINNPFAASDATVNSVGNLIVNLIGSSTFGPTFTIGAGLTTDDLDQNNNVASKKLTLASTASQTRTIAGTYTLGANLGLGGNIIINSNTIDTIGSIEILGNVITLQNSATWRNPIIFAGAVTVNTLTSTARTWTINDQTPLHGINIPSSFTVTSPATVLFDGVFSVNVASATSLSGTGIINFSNSFVNSNNAVTINPQTVSLNNVTFTGTGTFTLSPVDSNLNIANLVRAFTPTNYNGNTLTLTAATSINPLFSLGANPLTINGGILTITNGALTVNSRWVNNNGGLVFQGATTLGNSASFVGSGPLTFNNTVILTQNTNINNTVTFGFNPGFIIAVSNNGFVLTLNGPSVTVTGIVVSNGGSIVSSSPANAVQIISGGGVISADWTFANTVRLGNLNVTGARTLTFNLFLTNNLNTFFTDGVVFNGGTFQTLTTSDFPILNIEKSFTTNVATLLVPQITLNINGNDFQFLGTNTLTINGTVNDFATLTFTQNVVFGYFNVPTSSQNINLRLGTTGWLPSTANIQIFRSTITSDAGVNANILPTITFQFPTATSVSGPTNANTALNFQNNLIIAGTAFTTSNNAFLFPISITSLQNNTISGLRPTGTLNFISTTSPWVEPLVSFFGTLQQTLTLAGPIRMNNPNFGTGAQIVGPSRIAITNGLTVNNIFTFSAPVQLYVPAPNGIFTFTLAGSPTSLTFSTTPSLFNPLGFNLLGAVNFVVTSPSNQANILKFNLNTPLVIGDLTVTSGTVQFTSSSVNAGVVNVAGLASLWVDGTALTSQQLIFNQATDATSPSNFIFTIASATPTAVQTGAVVYKGNAQVNVVNFNWPGTPITAINAVSSNSPTANFLSVSGNPGFSYSSARSGNSVTFSRSANPSVSPFPTQSNGPSPAVSSSSIISFNMILFAFVLIFFIFN